MGGTNATVTDANVVLGILDPEFFLGGRIKLNRSLAERAIDRIAQRLGVGREEAAHAITTTSNHNMVAAIEEITVREGINPRDSFFVCGGGGTPCHIAEMADILGLKRYLIPRFVAGLSAFGGLISDLRWEENGTLHTSSRQFDVDRVNNLLRRLHESSNAFMHAAGVAPEMRKFEYAFFGRYEYQSWEIEVRFFAAGDLAAGDWPLWSRHFTRCMSASTASAATTTWSSLQHGRCAPSAHARAAIFGAATCSTGRSESRNRKEAAASSCGTTAAGSRSWCTTRTR